ncbi:predicted protein [Scheffersomyces stipitis CBS 6054]|uniref:Protein BZZ1 n=1 Tax=Scheffersomyces stipitis (strain ATCC 58785 / CBS 6054 / NBRC 10063 / NRRL Y-11545) TaxID=322104 RepID=A3LP15_PICST|nr:predicted protein [Scheffersomyces stipitis CBS 6054]ABN64971.2 predicted protein [Scheffersomyces stipitis CBS 6054]KAG2736494.1 hypothetical protein G9P44_000584 [Scheffersomyces stipitis]
MADDLQNISIGNELKDSYKVTSKWINNGINWLTDLEEFYRERGTIEKEYAAKLKELSKRHFDKKSKLSARLSVGDEPQITPGSLECASLVLWTDMLTQTEAIADRRLKFGQELNIKVADNLNILKGKSTRLAQQIDVINEYITSEKQKMEDDINKSKKHYDTLCGATETARDKSVKSASEKYKQKLEERTVDMNVGKNDYLIKINIANRLKDKYYFQDVPELLDYLQELNESRVGLINKLLKNASIIERNANDEVKNTLHLIDQTIDQNNPKLDTAMFIKHNVSDWKEPADFYFIPSSIWHDDEELVIKEPEFTNLKKRLSEALGRHSQFERACIDSKQKLEESTSDRNKDSENLTLKFDGKLSTSLSILSTFMKEDTKRVQNEVEIEIIQNFAGDKDLTYVEQAKQKKSKFGFLRGGSKKESTTSPDNGSADTQSLHTVKTSNSHHTFSSNVFSLRRNKTQTSTGPTGSGSGRALYEYVAKGDDEVTILAGETFTLIEEDSGNGWTLIGLSNGTQGLAPTSYLEIAKPIQADTTGSSSKKKGPSVAPRRGAKKVSYVEALYDYNADGDDEITIRAGDRIVLIQDDTDGSGWTEGELNGQRGLFPTGYVKKV